MICVVDDAYRLAHSGWWFLRCRTPLSLSVADEADDSALLTFALAGGGVCVRGLTLRNVSLLTDSLGVATLRCRFLDRLQELSVQDAGLSVPTPVEAAMHDRVTTLPQALCCWTQLTSLALDKVLVCDDDLIAVFKSLTQLAHFVLRDNRDVTDVAIGAMRCLHHLSSLTLEACSSITGRGLTSLIELSCLARVGIASCPSFGDAGMLHLCALRFVRVLLFTGCESVTRTGIGHLLRASFAGVLESLTFCACRSTRDSPEALTAAIVESVQASCRDLHLASCNEQHMTVTDLAALTRLHHLVSLQLSGCWYPTEEAFGFVLPTLTRLEVLDISVCRNLTDDAFHKICAALAYVKTLKFEECAHITSRAFARISALAHLCTLHIGGAVGMSDAALECIADVPHLTALSLSQCPKLTNRGLLLLCKMGTLRRVELHENVRISSAGAKNFAMLCRSVSVVDTATMMKHRRKKK